jgi:hypothetical protein
VPFSAKLNCFFWEKGDMATLNRILADDYFYVGVRGNVRTKANRLDDYEAGSLKFIPSRRTISIQDLRRHGFNEWT